MSIIKTTEEAVYKSLKASLDTRKTGAIIEFIWEYAKIKSLQESVKNPDATLTTFQELINMNPVWNTLYAMISYDVADWLQEKKDPYLQIYADKILKLL